jgi:hypothetical protein
LNHLQKLRDDERLEAFTSTEDDFGADSAIASSAVTNTALTT